MVDKLKNRINELSKSNETKKNYLKVFCEMEKSNELFKESLEFKQLKNNIKRD